MEPRFKKSSFSGPDNECVELAAAGLVRDSKNPHGPTLPADLPSLLAAIKTNRIPKP